MYLLLLNKLVTIDEGITSPNNPALNSLCLQRALLPLLED